MIPVIGIFLISLGFIVHPPNLRAEESVYVQFHGENVFSRLDPEEWKRSGADHLIVRVFRNQSPRGGLLFRNEEFRVLRPELKPFLESVSPGGPHIWAWMISRRFDWVREGSLLDSEYRMGTRRQIPKMDLFNPQSTERIVGVYRELSRLHPGGILIQDDLVIRSREGMSNWGLVRFARVTGRTADPDEMLNVGSPAHEQWVEIKSKQITSVLARIVRECKQANPGTPIGVNVYYESPLFPKKSVNWYGHNLRLLAETGVDRIFLMAYHRQMKRELKLTASATLGMFSRMVNRAREICGDRLVVKIQVRDWISGEWLDDKEVDELFRMIPSGIAGICLTPVKPGDLSRTRNLITRFRRIRHSHVAEKSRGKS